MRMQLISNESRLYCTQPRTTSKSFRIFVHITWKIDAERRQPSRHWRPLLPRGWLPLFQGLESRTSRRFLVRASLRFRDGRFHALFTPSHNYHPRQQVVINSRRNNRIAEGTTEMANVEATGTLFQANDCLFFDSVK